MKNICRALLLILTVALVFSLASCKEDKTPYSDELAKSKLIEVINILQRGEHLHTADYIPGMTEDDFEPVGEAILEVVGTDNSYEVTHVETSSVTDDDSNLVHFAEFSVKLGGDSINVVVSYVDGENTMYSLEIK